MKKQPKIKLEKSKTDFVLELLTLAILILYWAFVFSSLKDLPDSIPVHFDIHGNANSYGSKYQLLILPSIATLIFVLLLFLNKFPHIFNYPVKITEENAERIYIFATHFIKVLNLLFLTMFYFISFAAIKAAQSEPNKILIPILFIIFGGLVLGLLIYFIVKIHKLK